MICAKPLPMAYHTLVLPPGILRIRRQAAQIVGVQQQKAKIISKEQQKERGRVGQQQGREAENRFLKAWEDRHSYGISIAVRRATLHEDLHEKTDAWIDIKGYDPFRIQIKSRMTKKKEHHEFRIEGIILVSVLLADRYDEIRENTLEEIRVYLRIKHIAITF